MYEDVCEGVHAHVYIQWSEDNLRCHLSGTVHILFVCLFIDIGYLSDL